MKAPPPAVALRTVDSFDEIADETERSKALFVEAGRVIQHPSCLNCHPSDAHPRQGAQMALHEHMAEDPLVRRGWNPGEGREPAPGTQASAASSKCTGCHDDASVTD